MKLSSIIRKLRELQTLKGDINVYLASDEEGNSYGSIEEPSFAYIGEQNVVIIYPWVEHLEREELK